MSARSRSGGVLRRLALAAALGATVVAPAAAARLELPPVTRTTLRNGLTVLVMPTRRLPLVDFRLVARAGAVADPDGKEGLASLTAALLTQGAGTRDARAIAEAIAFVGGTLEAGAGAEQLVVEAEVLRKDFALGLELLRDCVVRPTFPEQEFQRKKDEALGGIASELDDPSSVADRALLPFLMGEHPLGHPVNGWKGSVERLTRQDVVDFHRARVTPGNAMLAVVGDVDPRAALAAIEKAFAGWKAPDAVPPPAVPALARTERRIRVVSKPEVTQTQIRLACAAVPRSHPDYYAIRIANTILGSGFTSRLVNEIRVVQGLTYSIGSRFVLYRDTGTFGVTTFTRNETLRRALDATLEVIRGLAAQGPTPEELAKAKRYLTGQFPLGLQAPDALAAHLLDLEFYGLDPRFAETFAERIDAVPMDEVRRVLRSHVCVDDLKILVVTRPELAKSALKGLGPLEVVEPL